MRSSVCKCAAIAFLNAASISTCCRWLRIHTHMHYVYVTHTRIRLKSGIDIDVLQVVVYVYNLRARTGYASDSPCACVWQCVRALYRALSL
jgi:hypothetical protein